MILSASTLGTLSPFYENIQEINLRSFSGVGRTTPTATVFPTAAENLIWQLGQSDDPLPLDTPDAVARLYDNSIVYGDLASTRGQNYTQFVSTATVARDMLEITRAHGRDKVLYWGTSYVYHLARKGFLADSAF